MLTEPDHCLHRYRYSMFKTLKPLILASGSPRRKVLLERLGLQFSVFPAHIDEEQYHQESAEDYVSRMARSKAAMVAAAHPDSWVIGADTIVVLDEILIGKPAVLDEAVAALMLLSGRQHQVKTAFCLCCSKRAFSQVRIVSTMVQFMPLTRQWAEAYAATGEPMDKAGAYGIQGRGSVLIERIEGSYSNVVGLPLAELAALLTELDLIAPAAVPPGDAMVQKDCR
jgi:septum formation protein